MHVYAARIAGLWLLTIATTVSASQVVWESLFDPVLAPGVDNPDPLFLSLLGQPSRSMQLSAATGGDFYSFAIDTVGQATIARHGATDDAVLWRRSVGVQHSIIQPGQALLAGRSTSDDGAWLSLDGAARFSAEGNLLWSRAIATSWPWPVYVRRYGNGDLALAQIRYDVQDLSRGSVIMRVDDHTGAIVAQRAITDAATPCAVVPIETDASDNLYVSLFCDGNEANAFHRLVRLAPDLSTLWDISLPAWDRSAPGYEQGVAVADGLYLAHRLSTDFRLSRFDASDGHLHWTVPGSWSSLRMAGGCLVGVRDTQGDRSVECLDPANGQTLWSRPLGSGHVVMDASPDIGVLAGVDATGSSGFVERFDLANGAPIWRTTLTASTAGRTFHPRDLLVSDSFVRVAGADCLPLIACANGIARVQTATGQVLAVTYPMLPQTATADAVADTGQSLLVTSTESVQGEQRIRVKQIDQSGSVTLEQVLPIAPDAAAFDSAKAVRLVGGNFATLTHSVASRQLKVSRYDGLSGQQVWQRSFWGALLPASASDLVGDSAGNILVSNVEDSGWPAIYWRWIEKRDAATGEAIWRMRLGMFTRYSNPVAFWLLGNDDLIVTEEIQGTSVPQGPRRHSGADGSIIWANPSLSGTTSWLLTQHDDEGYLGTADREVVAFSLADGSLRWRYVSSDPNVDFRSARVGSDGDLYVGGAGIADRTGRGAVVRLDRDTGAERWMTPLGDAAMRAPASPVEIVAAESGLVEAVQASASRRFLSRFDTETGGFVDGALLAARPEVDEAVADDGARIVQRLSDGSMLAYGLAYRPGESRRPWVGRLLAPAQGRHGDLSASLSLAPSAMPGGSALDLTAELRYVGEQNVQATAFVDFSRPPTVASFTEISIQNGPVCTISGVGTCQAVATPAGIRLQLDLAAGAVANLTATLRAPLLPATRFVAEVYAPYGFFEADLRNNAAVAWWVTDRYFADDFE